MNRSGRVPEKRVDRGVFRCGRLCQVQVGLPSDSNGRIDVRIGVLAQRSTREGSILPAGECIGSPTCNFFGNPESGGPAANFCNKDKPLFEFRVEDPEQLLDASVVSLDGYARVFWSKEGNDIGHLLEGGRWGVTEGAEKECRWAGRRVNRRIRHCPPQLWEQDANVFVSCY